MARVFVQLAPVSGKRQTKGMQIIVTCGSTAACRLWKWLCLVFGSRQAQPASPTRLVGWRTYLLVTGEALLELSDNANQADLLDATDRHGTQCLCLRTRCEVRSGTANARVQWTSNSGNQNDSQPSHKHSARLPDCQYEIVHAKAQLVAAFGGDDRPSVKKILRLDVS